MKEVFNLGGFSIEMNDLLFEIQSRFPNAEREDLSLLTGGRYGLPIVHYNNGVTSKRFIFRLEGQFGKDLDSPQYQILSKEDATELEEITRNIEEWTEKLDAKNREINLNTKKFSKDLKNKK